MHNPKIITFGEVMMRLSTPRCETFQQVKKFDVQFGGSECNVAICLANFGESVGWVSAVPDNNLGKALLKEIRGYDVAVDRVISRGKKLGINFLETGTMLRSTNIIYDRVGSSFSLLQPGDINFPEIFKHATWFHFSGISAAVARNTAGVCMEAIKCAKEMGLTVSCDLNYRSTLWSPEECQAVMQPLMAYVDVLLGGKEDAHTCLGIPRTASGSLSENGPMDYQQCEQAMDTLVKRFGVSTVGLTMRSSSHTDRDADFLSGVVMDRGTSFRGQQINLSSVIDRIGGGDGFSAAVIYGKTHGLPGQELVNLAVASCALAHTYHGDFSMASLDDVKHFAKHGFKSNWPKR